MTRSTDSLGELAQLARAGIRHARNPALLVLFHLVARWILKLYERVPDFDIPMHAAGGLVIAQFFSRVLRDSHDNRAPAAQTSILQALQVIACVSLAAVVWEFIEFTSDHFLHTTSQGGNTDTMGDIACGLFGGAIYLLGVSTLARLRRDRGQEAVDKAP